MRVAIDAKVFRHCVSDSLICLVRNEKFDFIRAQAGVFQNFARNVSHRAHRDFEKLVAFHLEEVVAGRQRFRSWRTSRAAAGRVQAVQDNVRPI